MMLKVGDSAYGGIVFDVNYKPYAWMIEWLQEKKEIIGFASIIANTEQGHGIWSQAHQIIKDPANFDQAGSQYNDWTLPSYDSLLIAYHRLHDLGLGNFQSNGYWTGTAEDDDPHGDAYFVNFQNKSLKKGHKGYFDWYVRAIRIQYLREI